MPVYTYQGKKWNIPEDKVEKFLHDIPGANLYEEEAKLGLARAGALGGNLQDDYVRPNPYTENFLSDEERAANKEYVAQNPKTGTSFDNIQPGISMQSKPVGHLDLPQSESIKDTNKDIYSFQKAKREEKDMVKGQLSEFQEDLQSKIKERDSIFDEEQKKKDQGKSTAIRVFEAPNPYSGFTTGSDGDATNYRVAEHFVNEAQNLINNVESDAGILKGVKDTAFNPDTWLLGLGDLYRSGKINQIVDKHEKGEELTDSENSILDALALNMAANAYHQAPRQYKWGQIAGESLPFMVEFILNPVAGAGKGIAKTIAKRAISKFGATGAAKTAIKAGSRAVGDVVGAAGMTATTGAPRTIADALNRNLGQATFDFDENGKITYTGHEGGEDAITSALKAAGASTIEYASEMVGSAGAGALIGKAMPKGWTKAIKASEPNLIRGLRNSNLYKETKALMQKGQWSGTLGEYMEEAYGTAMNAIFIGDNKLSDLTDIDQQVDTFMGLALTGGVMGTVNTSAYVIDRTRTANQLKKADSEAAQYIANWDGIKEQLKNLPVEERSQTIKDVLKRNDLTIPAKKAFADYTRTLTYRDALLGAAEQKLEESRIEAEQNGIQLVIDDKRRGLLSKLNREKIELEAKLGNLANIPEDQFGEYIENNQLTDEQINDWNTYNQRRNEYNGLVKQLREEIDREIEPAIQDIKRVTRRDGQIIYADFGSEGTLPVVNGNVSINEDGSIDKQNTDDSLTVLMPNGKKRIISSKFISGSPIINTPAELEEEVRQNAYDIFVSPIEEAMNGTERFTEGTPVEYVDEKGQTQAGTVVSTQGNTVTVVPNDGNKSKIRTFTHDQLRNSLVKETLGDVQVRDEFTVDIPEGYKNIRPGQYKVQVEEIKDGTAILRFIAPGETDQYIPEATIEDIAAIKPIIETPQAPVETQEDQLPQGELSAVIPQEQEVPEIQEQTTPDVPPLSFIDQIPKGEKGTLIFEQAPIETTVGALGEVYEDQEELTEVVKATISNIQKQIEKTKTPKPTGDINKDIANKQAAKQQLLELNNKLEYWNSIQTAVTPIPTPYEERIASIEQGGVKKRESNMGEYLSLRDYLLRNIGTGKFKFLWNSNEGKKGLRDEIFSSKNTEPERRKRIAFLNNKDGYTPESLAEELFENAGQGSEINPGWFNDVQDIRNEIIDILLSHDTPTSMIDAATELRRQPESIEEYYENFVDPELMDQYGEVEEVEVYEEGRLPFEAMSDEELDDYFGDLEEKINFEEKNYGLEETRTGTDRSDADIVEQSVDDRGEAGDSRTRPFEETDYIQDTGETGITPGRIAQAGIDQTDREGAENESDRSIDQEERIVDEIDVDSENNTNFVENETSEVSDKSSPGEFGEGNEILVQSEEPLNKLRRRIETAQRNASTDNDNQITSNDVRHNEEQELQDDQRLEQERSAGREENARAARRLGRYRQANSRDVQDSQSSKSEQERELREYAEQAGLWLDEKDIASNAERKIPSGKEANVYLNKDGKTVTKVINYSKYSKNPLDFIEDRVLLFNELFDGTPYTIVGYTQTDKGFSFVVEQPYIKGTILGSPVLSYSVETQKQQQKRVADYMRKKFGMESAGLDAFSDGSITIQDLHLKNVIEGEDGNLYVIDAIPSIKEASEETQPSPKFTGDLPQYLREVVKNQELSHEAEKVDTTPTEAQKEAGNYKKGHVKVQGFDITIENPAGSVRSGVDREGNPWSVEMKNHYGYFKRTEGYDGDHIDVFVGPNPESGKVFVVDQVDPEAGAFDESKVMLGFNSIDEARAGYLSNYEEGWQGLGSITETNVEDFKKWLYDGAKQRKAFSEYREVASAGSPREKEMQAAKDGTGVVDNSTAAGATFDELEKETDTGIPVSDNMTEPSYGSSNTLISSEQYEELRRRMREKLNNLNMGFDPELFTIGTQMAMYHIEAGARKFADFAKRMIEDLGENVRPYLKSFYESARHMPGMENIAPQMDSPSSVKSTDVNDLDAKKEKKSEKKSDISKQLSIFEEDINNNNHARILQTNSNRLPKGESSEILQGTQGSERTGRNSDQQSEELSRTDGTQQRSADGRRNILSGNADVLIDEQPALVEFNAQSNDTESFNKSKKYADNISAIETLLTILKENRKATPEEKTILSKYVGFGGLKEILQDPDNNNSWKDGKYRDQVRRIIELSKGFDELTNSDDTLNKIRGSILNAHFTSDTVISAIYKGLNKLGFKSGRILEPSAGIGNFITYMPESIKGKSNISAVELDKLTGNILKAIHDNTYVQISGIENANIPDNSQDLVISNIPFGNYKVYDRAFKGDKEQFLNRIHNYFFAKALDKVREGGIIAFVTSKGVLDSPGNENLREYLNKNADFLGAVRLPNSTFLNTANTQVVTDIIFLKKNSNPSNANFVNIAEVEARHKDGETEKVFINQYFIDNPQNVLGEIEAGGMYNRSDYTLKDNGSLKDLAKVIKEALPANVYTKGSSAMGLNVNDLTGKFENVKEGNILLSDGRLYRKEEGVPVEVKLNEPVEKVKKYINLRDALMELIYSEYANLDPETVKANRKKLNDEYDGFINEYGKLEKSINKISKFDADGYNVLSLENKGQKADIFTKRTINPVSTKTRAESIDEAIIISLSETAGIDMERIGQLMGMTIEEVKTASKGKIFERPEGGYVTRDEYLSGNVKRKLAEAKQAVESGFTEFQDNVDELERVIPADIPAIQIESRLGSRWIPASVYTDFARHLLKDNQITISYSKGADQYFSSDSRLATVEAKQKFGTDRVNGVDILLSALHINPPKVYDYWKDEFGSQHRELNKEETDRAVQKYQEVRDLFEDWVYKSPERRELLSKIYNEKFNTTVKRKYDGSHLNIPGINGVTLRPHQKDAIWMLLQNNGGVIDHLVGAGKTYVMVAGTMEMKRTGIAKKPMIIALKSTIPQIVKTYRTAYPMAKILAPMEKDFEKENRKKLFSKIANNEWDVIIMSHENYGKIPHETDIQKKLINEELKELESERVEFDKNNDRVALKGLEIRIKNLNARLEKLSDISKDNSLTFEQMGVDHIMVDESQQFKNLSYVTKQRGIAGLGNSEGSKRSFNLLVGVRYLQDKLKGDKGVTFLSGTPITNSIVEMYSLLNYLRPNKMAELGFTSFDAWATTFANPTTDIEFTVTGNFKQKTRFREFMNVPELSMLYTEIADIRTDENLKLDKPHMKGNGYTVVEVQMNDDQKEFAERLMKFAETKDGELIGRGPLNDNEKSAAMLLATNLSSKMAIDMRLINPSYPYDSNGKIAKLVNNVVDYYNKTEDHKGTQLIFSDLGTPKNAGNKSALLRDYLEDEVGLDIDSLNQIFGDVMADNYRYPSITAVRDKMIDVIELTNEEADQLIADSENSASKFDIYNEIKKRLIEKGIPEDQIVFIHDYNTARKKEALFNKVNDGRIRIILGSTQKLGTGVNVQKRVVAVHHIDVPWTPASMEQRNGRALRQGNLVAKEYMNNELPVFAYATERTLDAYKYQLLQTKQTFLNQVKSGEVTERVIKEGEGDSESGVGYAELVAMLSGNQDILQKSRLEEKLNRLKRAKRNFEGELYEAIEQKRRIEERIPEIEQNIKKSEQNVRQVTNKAQFDETGKLVINSFNGEQFKPKKEKGKEIPVERTDYAKAAIEYIENRMKKMQFGELDRFNIGGYNIEFYVVPSGEGGMFSTAKKANASLVANGVKYAINVSSIPGVFLNNIQKAVTDQIPSALKSQQNLLQREKNALSSYDEIINRGDAWPKQEEMDAVVKELREVTERLNTETNREPNLIDTETLDAENNDIRFRSVSPIGFYSTVENALDKIKQEKGTKDQFRSMLLKNGAKQAELDWMGFDELPAKLTKQEIQDWIDQNRIEVEEVEKGAPSKVEVKSIEPVSEKYATVFTVTFSDNSTVEVDLSGKYDNDPSDISEREIAEEAQKLRAEDDLTYEGDEEINPTKYSQYVLPGGKNYKELLLTMPYTSSINREEVSNRVDSINAELEELRGKGHSAERISELLNERDRLITELNNEAKSSFKSSHFDELNILAHIRFNEREVNRERVLFIEEIQSDWAQEGRRKGFESDYQKELANLQNKLDQVNSDLVKTIEEAHENGLPSGASSTQLSDFSRGVLLTVERARLEARLEKVRNVRDWDEIQSQLQAISDKQQQIGAERSRLIKERDSLEEQIKRKMGKPFAEGVPDMPFKSTDQWLNLAMRRMMRYAAENGFDRIAWTTGEQQADRYDLSKHVDDLEYNHSTGQLIGRNKNSVVVNTAATKETLPDIVGKEAAEKLLSNPERTDALGAPITYRLQGEELKFGGEGMKSFYNQIVPKVANKLGKPFNTKVEEFELPEIGKQQSIPVTEAMKESVMEGVPLFRKRSSREEYAKREWNRAKSALTDIAKRLHVDVEILETTEGLTGKKSTAKGWYDPKTGKITIVMPNHSNSLDVQATLLHEAVGHHGLRELFGEHFDTFLDNVYNNADGFVKHAIDGIIKEEGLDQRTATEEYLSYLAEDRTLLDGDGASGWFGKVKQFFLDMLSKVGINLDIYLSDNELRYILWRSYQNLKNPGRYKTPNDSDREIQSKLKVGEFVEQESAVSIIAEDKENTNFAVNEYNKWTKGELDRLCGGNAAISRTIESARVGGGNDRATTQVGQGGGTRESLLGEIVQRAKENGTWIDDIQAVSSGEYIGHGQEHEVYRAKDGKSVVKLNNLDFIPKNATDLNDFINRALTQNELFPSDAFTILGFAYNSKREISVVLQQPYVLAEREATDEEIDQFLEDHGFTVDIRDIWSDGRYEITDLKTSNVLVDTNGRLRFIDVVAKKTNPPGDDRVKFKNTRIQKADTLMDNADNLKKVIKYPKFLSDVLNGPTKEKLLSEAREKGYTNLDKVIENYLSEVEDPEELKRIKELLGTEMPDNALRYLLWRNANPNDGTPKWKAMDAVKTHQLDSNILFRKQVSDSAITEYERRVRSRHNRGFKSLMTGLEEGWFDRMNSLKILQDAIMKGKDIPDRMNAYLLENQLSSKNTSEIRTFNKLFIDPMIEAAQKIFGRDIALLDNYLNAKHGLERNEYMARQQANTEKEKQLAKLREKEEKMELTKEKYEKEKQRIDEHTEKRYEYLLKNRDYSGLTAIAEERDQGETFTEAAEAIVKEVEENYPEEDIKALWVAINNANTWMLKKQYDSGMMTKETYEKVSSMYQYYVPLRGFAETTAEEVYEYLENETSDFNKVLRKAYGRTSKAESPFANMISMGESGIMQANKNSMKQAFYRLVATNPSNLAKIDDVWYVEKAGGEEWVEEFPDIPSEADGDQVTEIIREFNERMSILESQGKAAKGRNKLDLGMKIGKGQASEHAVRVWIGGEERVIYINGNPRAAQAINGLTNSSLVERSNTRRQIEFWGRQMAANFTSRNPAFMVTNFMRDVQFALVSAAIKEGGMYSFQLAANAVKVPKTIAMNVFGEGGGQFDKYWKEFTLNGGETGYANLNSIDYHRKYVNKKLREFSGQRDLIAPFRAYVEFMENSNRLVEDISRFATYVTSRQNGRSIERSVSDAKEITINFNRKGSGKFGASLIHSFYLFSNPALQGLRLIGMLAKNNPVRFTAAMSSTLAMGYFAPILNEILLGLFGDDDDKGKYWNLSDWTRRNNLVLYAPWTKDKFLTFTLSHELRPFYGMGEIIHSYQKGNMITKNPMQEIAKQFTAILPIDPFAGQNWWVPSAVLPIWESYVSNSNFTGAPVYKNTPWNKLDPEWTKAYKSTPKPLIEGAKWLNEVSGGDDVVKGKIDINPARIAHVFRGYMGGFLTTYTDLANVSFNLLTGNDLSINDIPVANKLIRTSDDRTESTRINQEYYYYLDWITDYEHRQRGYKGKTREDREYIKKYINLIRSDEKKTYMKAKQQVNRINKLRERDPQKAEEAKKKFVEEMRLINN